MGLPMFREPNPDDSSKSTAKINTDNTARARSTIRRQPVRQPGRRSRPTDSSIGNRIHIPGTVNESQRSPQRDNELDAALYNRLTNGLPAEHDEETFVLAAAFRHGITPGSEEHNELREFFRHSAPLARQARSERTGTSTSGSGDFWLNERRRRLRRAQEVEQQRDRAGIGSEESGGHRSNFAPPQVIISTSSGLGDRRRSPSPEESPWEILRATIPPDERLPSASSSFASTAASSSASLSQEHPARNASGSPATTVSAPSRAISLYPRRLAQRGPTPHPPVFGEDDAFSDLFVCDDEDTSDSGQDDGPVLIRAPISQPLQFSPATFNAPLTDEGFWPSQIFTGSSDPNILEFEAETDSNRSDSPRETVAPRATIRASNHSDGNEAHRERRQRARLRRLAFLRSRVDERIRAQESSEDRHSQRPFQLMSQSRNTDPHESTNNHSQHGIPAFFENAVEALHAEMNVDPESVIRETIHAPTDDHSSQTRREGHTDQNLAAQINHSSSRERERPTWASSHRTQSRNEREEMDLDEVEERYARLEEQEIHLNHLLDCLCQRLPVPDRLWALAGVERRGVEDSA